MRSRIYAADCLPNRNRKFGSALRYFVAELVTGAPGGPVPLLLTQADVDHAAQRAAVNPEDVEAARRQAAELAPDEGTKGVFAVAAAALVGFVAGALVVLSVVG